MPDIPLLNPTSVARTGGTVGYTSLSLITDPAGEAVSATYPLGSKSLLVRMDVDVPLAPLPSNTQACTITIIGRKTGLPYATRVKVDYAAVGNLSGPIMTALLPVLEIGTGDTTLGIAFDNLTPSLISDLNAGTMRVWVGFAAMDPVGAFDAGNWSIATVPTSPRVATSSLLNTTFEVTPTYIGGGSAPPQIMLELTGTSDARGSAPNFTGSASVNNGLGASASDSIAQPSIPPQNPFVTAGPTTVQRLLSNAGTTTVDMSGTCTLTTFSPGVTPLLTQTLTNAIVAPTAATVYLKGATFSVTPPDSRRILVSPILATPALSDTDMKGTAYLNDTWTVAMQTSDPATGGVVAPDATPTYEVWNSDGTVLVASGNMVSQGQTGWYAKDISIAAPTYSVGETYVVRGKATVSGTNAAGVIDAFVVRPSIGNSVWSDPLVSEVVGRPTTMGGALRRVLTMQINRLTKSGNVVVAYDDDQTTTLGQQGYSVTETGFDRSNQA